jgi:hypothetical protein
MEARSLSKCTLGDMPPVAWPGFPQKSVETGTIHTAVKTASTTTLQHWKSSWEEMNLGLSDVVSDGAE